MIRTWYRILRRNPSSQLIRSYRTGPSINCDILMLRRSSVATCHVCLSTTVHGWRGSEFWNPISNRGPCDLRGNTLLTFAPCHHPTLTRPSISSGVTHSQPPTPSSLPRLTVSYHSYIWSPLRPPVFVPFVGNRTPSPLRHVCEHIVLPWR